MAEQQKRHVETYVESMQSHIHIHKKLQRAMYRMWRKMVPAHANRHRITTQLQNKTCTSSRYVQH